MSQEVLSDPLPIVLKKPMSDFRCIPVLPRAIDLLKPAEEPFLRPNLVNGRYSDVDHYLDVQFRLLREDCLRPLREAIAFYGDGRRANLRLFTSVRIRRTRRLADDRLVHEVTFNPKVRNADVDWEDGRLLKFGSLLCLSRDHFRSTVLVGVVADGRPERLKKGRLLIDFETVAKNVAANSGMTYVMLESEAYFEAYRHNLEALQERRESNFPLREYFVEVRNTLKPPSYLTLNSKYDFGPMLLDKDSHRGRVDSVVLKPSSWPTAEALGMDPSQWTALQTALTMDLAIIQGPPGTGKTFVGLSIVKALLNNVVASSATRPILIVCYTNHALDQFLEGVLRLTKKVVRMGSRCRSHKLQEHATRRRMEPLRTRTTVHNAAVVGMTTTGAAKRRDLLRILKPRIVILEEAAEVLEAHAFTALNEHTQHLILIGDHRQLRPRTAVHALARDYQLDVSLFERLLLNGIPYCTLGVQHRMRPCIARLLVPHVYANLEDHPCVAGYEHVRGMERDLFFVSHDVEEMREGATSRANQHEARFLIGLGRHLRLQNYAASELTILATYSGQVLTLQTLQKEEPLLEGVRITTVDNFQGEENDIVLLSLVRSNAKGNIGFLRTENRVCVALSRARKGLYCIGNLDLLQKHSPLWMNIVRELRDQGATGPTLRVKCGPHGHLEDVTVPSDFEGLMNGGCSQICGFEYSCEHEMTCKEKCHPSDQDHVGQPSSNLPDVMQTNFKCRWCTLSEAISKSVDAVCHKISKTSLCAQS